MHKVGIALACVLVLTTVAADAQSSLPDPQITPGVLNPYVTQNNIDQTICRKGWTQTIRPPEAYTEELKRAGIRQYGYADRRLEHYEEDHFVPLGLGGHPTDPHNLWPQPFSPPDGWGAYVKDDLERRLNFLVCTRRISLTEAQSAIMTNWIDAYNHYVVGE